MNHRPKHVKQSGPPMKKQSGCTKVIAKSNTDWGTAKVIEIPDVPVFKNGKLHHKVFGYQHI